MTIPEGFFVHTNSPEWVAYNEDMWTIDEENKVSDGYDPGLISAFRAYSFSGDLPSFIDACEKYRFDLELGTALSYCPILTKKEFEWVVNSFINGRYGEREFSETEKAEIARMSESVARWVKSCFFRLDDTYESEYYEAARDIVGCMLGQHFEERLEYVHSFPLIGPISISVEPHWFAEHTMKSLRSHLFSKEGHESYAAYRQYVPILLELLPTLDKRIFATTREEWREVEYDLLGTAEETRQFLVNLYGFVHDVDLWDEDDFACMDEAYRDELKESIEQLELGEEYNQLIDMIRRHDGKIEDIDE